MADVNLGVLASTTLQNYRETLADNIFKENVLMNHYKANGGVEYKDGGRQIVVPLMYGKNSTAMAFSGADTLDLTYQTGIDAATYEWRYYDVSAVITLEDELKNSGKSQIIDLVKAKIMQAENSLKELINQDMFSGTAASKEIDGVETAVGTGTYGGIAGGTYSWWQSYVNSTSEVLAIDQIRTGMNTVNNGAGGSKCSVMVTTQPLHEKYESLLAANLQHEVGSSSEINRLGDAGFGRLGFRGVPVVYDEQVATGNWFFLNPKNSKIVIHKDADFRVVKKAEPADQHVSVQHIVTSLQFVVNRRKSLGKLTGKTTS